MPRVHDDITLGERVRSLELGGLAVHEVRYRPGIVMPPHAHRHTNLTFVFSGAIEETALGESRCLGVCDAVIKPAGTLHSNRCGPTGARSLVIEFRDPMATAWLNHEGNCATMYAPLCGPELMRGGLRVAEVLRQHGQAASAGDHPNAIDELREAVIETLALAAGSSADESQRAAPRWLEQAHELLHEAFARPLRVQELAARLELHPVYLARAFRRRHRCSITTYRRRLQVAEAARRMANEDEPLALVALRCGFADQSHLCRAFHAAFGVAPGAFRKLARGN